MFVTECVDLEVDGKSVTSYFWLAIQSWFANADW